MDGVVGTASRALCIVLTFVVVSAGGKPLDKHQKLLIKYHYEEPSRGWYLGMAVEPEDIVDDDYELMEEDKGDRKVGWRYYTPTRRLVSLLVGLHRKIPWLNLTLK